MRFIKFKVVSDDNLGGYGILPNIFRNWPNYSPSIAVSNLGHDLVEHGTREIGAFHQEVAATGAYLYTRLLSGNVQITRGTMEHAAASNKAQEWHDSTINYLPPAPKVIILDKYDHTLLDNFFEGLKTELELEWGQQFTDVFDYDDEDGEIPECPYTTVEAWPNMVGWLKYGYASAKKRYGSEWLGYRLYRNIDTVIQNNWNRLEDYANTGAEFTLVLDKSTGEVNLRGPEWW